MVLRHDFNNGAPDFGEPSQPQGPADDPWAAYEYGAPTDDKQGHDRYAAMLNTTPPAHDSRGSHTPTTPELSENSFAHTFPAPNSPDIQAAPINRDAKLAPQEPEKPHRLTRRGFLKAFAITLAAVGGVEGGLWATKGNDNKGPKSKGQGGAAPGKSLTPEAQTALDKYPISPTGKYEPVAQGNIHFANTYPGNAGWPTTVNGQQIVLPRLPEPDGLQTQEMLYKGYAYQPITAGNIALAFAAAAISEPSASQEQLLLLGRYADTASWTQTVTFFSNLRQGILKQYSYLTDSDEFSIEFFDDPANPAQFAYMFRDPNYNNLSSIHLDGGKIYWRLINSKWQDPNTRIPEESGGVVTTFGFGYQPSDPSVGNDAYYRNVDLIKVRSMMLELADRSGNPSATGLGVYQ